MKFNPKILSIPPYISTSWKNIASLHVENHGPTFVLVVTLHSGARIEVPHLEGAMIEAIFASHARYLEQEEKTAASRNPPRTPLGFPLVQEQTFSVGFPLKGGFPGVENMGSLLQHDPAQANGPDLPPDMLDKITELSKTLGIEDPNAIPKPEPHCNCMHCQIARALEHGCSNKEREQKENNEEEIVSDEDLKFRTWDVSETTDEKLFLVTNPLEPKEQYHVYLGEQIGCTCGERHCEHIQAVLKS